MSFALRSVWLAALVSLGCSCSREPDRPKVDHVVVILVDTLRADHLSPYGYHRDTSPALADLAARGARFENAVSQCSWTSPSVVSLFTGQYVADERLTLPADRPALAEAFQRAGFETAAFIFNDIINEKNAFARGFDVFEQFAPYDPSDRIVAWLQGVKGKRSFTYIHLAEPHDDGGPYQPPTKPHFRKEPAKSLREGRVEYYQKINDALQLHDFEQSVMTIRQQIAGYDDDVTVADKRIGALMWALREAGIDDQTAIVVTADHGEGLWTREAYDVGQRHTKLSKDNAQPTLVNTLMNTHGSQVNLELVHVPLLLKAPGVPAGLVIESWVENVDVAPTVLELADVAASGVLHGKSLLPLLDAPKSEHKPYVFSMTRFVRCAIDRDRVQLIVPTARGECELGLETQLYDLKTDPEARVNLAAQRPQDVARLAQAIAQRFDAKVAIPGEHHVSEDNRELLAKLGYLESGTVADEVDLSQETTKGLLTALLDPTTVCMAQVEILRELVKRELDDDQRAALQRLREKTSSKMIKAELDRVLAPR